MAIHTPHRRSQPRSRRRPFLLWLVSFVVLIGLAVGGIHGWRWMQKPTSFPITHVIVQGEFAHVSPQDIQSIIQHHLTGGFFSLNLDTIRGLVLTYPWIQHVSFRRVWPGTLRVHIQEKIPLARFGTSGVLSVTGEVFYPEEKTIPLNLPILEGPPDQAAELTHFYTQASILIKVINLSISALRIDAEHSWTMVLSNGLIVRLGRQDALVRFKRFVAIYPKIAASTKGAVVTVDLRYPDGLAVQFSSLEKTPKK